MARFLLIEEALREEEREKHWKRRRLRDKFMQRCPSDGEFVKSFRLTKELFEELCQEIVPLLPAKKNSRSIDPITKILSALSFYGRGSYQGAVGKDLNAPLAQQTVSKCLKQVTEALNKSSVVRKFVKFPQNKAEREVIKKKFYDKYGLPGVCGCIDCTHIAIIRPKDNEERYYNRKGYHSLNVQVVCDANNLILNADASYGGATKDSFIWQNSELREHFEELHGERALLLGDSGYPLREYMMIPVEGASADSPEGRYNEVQKSARSAIERTFRILKGRWRCLLAARKLHYSPDVAGNILIACTVLHNMCISAQVEPIELSEEEYIRETRLQPAVPFRALNASQALQRGQGVRQEIINSLNI